MQVTTTSASRAASAGVAACRTPNSFAKSAARDAVRFHTVSGRPEAATRAAIGRPIAPSPKKAMCMRQNLSSAYVSRMITTVTVDGMTCQHCVRAVFTALAGVPGVDRAEVSIGSARVEHDGSVTVAQLRDAIAVAGYTVREGATNRRALPLA
jgi:copper chaperone